MKHKFIFKITYLILLIVVTCNFGCEKKKKDGAKKADLLLKPVNVTLSDEVLFLEKIKHIQIIETGSDNIAIWAKSGIRNKTLVLIDFSINLQYEIQDNLLLEAKNLIDTENYELLDAYTGVTKKYKKLYNAQNYIYAAYRFGIVKDVVWILPISGSVTPEYLDFFKTRLKENPSYFFSEEDIDSFTFSKNKLTGNLLGIPITVITIDDLTIPDEPVIVSLDLSYLSSFVINDVTTPIENITVAFLKSFQKKPLLSSYITIVNSNKTFNVPMRFRFLSIILKDIFQNPELMNNPKEVWIMKQFADEKLVFVNYEDAAKEYEAILKITPDDPSIYYQFALINIKKKDFNKAAYSIEEAIKRDNNFILAYVDLLSLLEDDDKKLELLTLGNERHPDDISILFSMSGILFKKGEYHAAVEAYLKLINLGMESYDLNFSLAACYFNLKNYEKAKEVYNSTFSLLTDVLKEYYSFYYLDFAETYQKLSDNKNALKYYKLYLKYNKTAPNANSIRLKVKEIKKGA